MIAVPDLEPELRNYFCRLCHSISTNLSSASPVRPGSRRPQLLGGAVYRLHQVFIQGHLHRLHKGYLPVSSYRYS